MDAIQTTVVTIGFAAVFALAAVGVFVPAAVRHALVVATLAALVIWVTAEDFGGLLSGSATEPRPAARPDRGGLLAGRCRARCAWLASAQIAGPRWLAIRPNRPR